MRIKFIGVLLLGTALFLGSCSTPKNISYFQDVQNGTIVTTEQQLDIKLKPEDKLTIMVSSSEPALAQQFNLVQVQNRLGSTTSTTKLTSSINGSSQTMPYEVNREGNINFPVLGTIHVAGLNRYQVAELITDKIKEGGMIKDPIVIVDFSNTGISILGEVSAPGRYEFNKANLTIVDAIAMAGDLKMNGDRTEILVMRKDGNGVQQGYRINLLDMQQLANSPVYYLQQDDIIYVQPNAKAKRETTPNGNTPYTPSFWMSLTSFAITLVTLVLTFAK